MQLLILLVRLIFATFSQRGINHDILAVQSMKEEKKKKKKKRTHLFLHFWQIYFLSPSCILIAPDLITIPLRVRRIPRWCTRTRPMLGKVSNYIKQNKTKHT